MPNAFISRDRVIIPFDKVTSVSYTSEETKLRIIVGESDWKISFKSPGDLETQRDAFLAYLTPTTKPLI